MKVYLDPGHGGFDSGAVAGSLVEAKVNLSIALAAAERLRAAGVEVKMSRTGDSVPGKNAKSELVRRTNEANSWGAHAYVSIHCNYLGTGKASGIETYVQQASSLSQDLGRRIQAALVAATGLPDRGVRTRDLDDGKTYLLGQDPDKDADYFHVLRESKMPAVLIECGFLDHPTDGALLGKPDGQKRIGCTIADAVLGWGQAHGLVKQSAPQQPQQQPVTIVDASGRVLCKGWLEGGRAVAAVRELAEAMGMAVDWNPSKATVTLQPKRQEVLIVDASGRVLCKGWLEGGRAVAIVRELGDAMGLAVDWNQSKSTVTLRWPGQRK